MQQKSGRAYIPDNVPQGFISSHSIENYKWIFEINKNTMTCNRTVDGNKTKGFKL